MTSGGAALARCESGARKHAGRDSSIGGRTREGFRSLLLAEAAAIGVVARSAVC